MDLAPSIETPRVPITFTYHGVDVTDDYRWLEDPSDEQVVKWTVAQNDRTRAHIDAVFPI